MDNLLQNFNWLRGLVDVLIMSFLVYQLYSWFKNTRTLQILIGLGFLGVVYLVTKSLGLFMTSWVLQELGTVVFILIIVIFQAEIRQALYRFSLLRNLFGRTETPRQLDVTEIAGALFSLVATRTGAIIVFQRDEPVEEYVLHGVPLDSLVSSQLLIGIFNTASPLHDGAVVVKDGRVAVASGHLPLSVNPDIPQAYGTRHRAALGLSERSDAVIAVVSEERGEVSLAVGGELKRVASPERLAAELSGLLQKSDYAEKARPCLRELLFRNLRPKLAVVTLVVLCWVFITGRQGDIIEVSVPLRFHNLPENLALIHSSPEEVDVQLRAVSSLLPSPKNSEISADIDLRGIREGRSNVTLTSGDFHMPLGVTVSGINPPSIKVATEKKVVKKLKVKVPLTHAPRDHRRVRRITVSPSFVTAEGPEGVMSQLDSVETEDLDLSTVSPDTSVEKKLIPPAPTVRLLRDNRVTVTASLSRK